MPPKTTPPGQRGARGGHARRHLGVGAHGKGAAQGCALLAGLAIMLASKTQDAIRKEDAFNGRVQLPFIETKPPKAGARRIALFPAATSGSSTSSTRLQAQGAVSQPGFEGCARACCSLRRRKRACSCAFLRFLKLFDTTVGVIERTCRAPAAGTRGTPSSLRFVRHALAQHVAALVAGLGTSACVTAFSITDGTLFRPVFRARAGCGRSVGAAAAAAPGERRDRDRVRQAAALRLLRPPFAATCCTRCKFLGRISRCWFSSFLNSPPRARLHLLPVFARLLLLLGLRDALLRVPHVVSQMASKSCRARSPVAGSTWLMMSSCAWRHSLLCRCAALRLLLPRIRPFAPLLLLGRLRLLARLLSAFLGVGVRPGRRLLALKALLLFGLGRIGGA